MFLNALGRIIVHFLQKDTPGYKPAAQIHFSRVKATLKPGDILLVEGNQRISVAIKYLTQSSWSHAALYVGNIFGDTDIENPKCLIEADPVEGIVAAPLSKYAHLNTRICRAVNLEPADLEKLIKFAVNKRGLTYDLRNVFDLMRYLLPQPPVPVRWRRRMLALGSGDPTRAICSTLIAQVFQSIRYPILPDVVTLEDCKAGDCTYNELLHIRHYSLFTPRDFDLSPYFSIVKPLIEQGFNYRLVLWRDSQTQKRELPYEG